LSSLPLSKKKKKQARVYKNCLSSTQIHGGIINCNDAPVPLDARKPSQCFQAGGGPAYNRASRAGMELYPIPSVQCTRDKHVGEESKLARVDTSRLYRTG
jgi:hypothetical protein